MIEKYKYLPRQYKKSNLHRLDVEDEIFDALEEVRSKYRLWDRKAAIIHLLQKYGYLKTEE